MPTNIYTVYTDDVIHGKGRMNYYSIECLALGVSLSDQCAKSTTGRTTIL